MLKMKIIVHEAMLIDSEDPAIYAAVPIYEWEQSDSGRWVMANALTTPNWKTVVDYNTANTKVQIIADLKEQDITYFKLKWH